MVFSCFLRSFDRTRFGNYGAISLGQVSSECHLAASVHVTLLTKLWPGGRIRSVFPLFNWSRLEWFGVEKLFAVLCPYFSNPPKLKEP